MATVQRLKDILPIVLKGMTMTAPVDDGVPNRPTTTHRTKDGASFIEVHVVDDDSAGEVQTVDGTRLVKPGDVLVATNRPEIWNVYSEDAFGEMGTSEAEPGDVPQPVDADVEFEDETPDESPGFDPSEHSAAEVREYLDSPNVDEDTKRRVVEAERANKNRATAIPLGW
jgi:hypothetical protein